MGKYILAIDQSTQGTKSMLLDYSGRLIASKYQQHRQIINDDGLISHDPEEIYEKVLLCVRELIEDSGIDNADIVCVGISNQRETSLVWDRATGESVCNAVVWQCSRSRTVCESILAAGYGPLIQSRTGIPVSPYFPASKLAWILENVPGIAERAKQHTLCFGTIDTWLVYKLTSGKSYKTDFSNASRSQLFNLETLKWDEDICRIFGLNPSDLPEICPSDDLFGTTDFGGILPAPIPICAVMGDSNAAMFGQNCREVSQIKATYGTGSSIMMNVGSRPIRSEHGLVTSLAWKFRGQVQYVLEGNINYSGAVVRWLQKDLGLISSPEESGILAEQANTLDTTYLVPSFSGMGAPYWDSRAKAIICGISRVTGKAEIVKAGLDSIAYQITDVINAMEKDSKIDIIGLRVDGAPTNNKYLMQMQSNLLGTYVLCPSAQELSGIGVAFMAGLSINFYADNIFESLEYTRYEPKMSVAARKTKFIGWHTAVDTVLSWDKKGR